MSQAPDKGFINALLLDGFFQSFLLGTLVMQAIKYWYDYRDDSCSKRVLVVSVMLLSVLQTILEDYKVWRSVSAHLLWSTSPIQWSDFFLNGCICSLCQAFYIERCWALTARRYWVLPPLLTLLALTVVANVCLAVVIGIAFNDHGDTNDTLNVSRNLLPSTIVTFTLWMVGTLVLEVCVTLTSVVVLWKSRTGSLQSDKIINRIIIITWESAALPSICTITAAALYRAVPYTYDHVVILLVLQTGKLYALSMFRSLTMRAKLRQKFGSVNLGRTSLHGWNWETWPEARTSTVCGSDARPESFKAAEEPVIENLELRDIRCPCHSLINISEGQPEHLNTPCPTTQDSGRPRNRFNSWRSS